MAQWARENLHYIQHQFIHFTWETKMESWNHGSKFWRCQRNIKLNLKSHHKCYKCPERQTFFTSIGILILRFSSLDGVRNVYICSMVFSLHEVQDTIWNEGKLFIHYNIQLYITWWIKNAIQNHLVRVIISALYLNWSIFFWFDQTKRYWINIISFPNAIYCSVFVSTYGDEYIPK